MKRTSISLAANRIAKAGGILLTMDSLSQRGGERVGILLANGFARTGIPVRIVLMRNAGDAEAELRAMLHEDVSILSAGRRLSVRGGKYLERARAVPFIRRQIRLFRPAVVLCTINSLGLVTALSRNRANVGPSFAIKLTNPVVPPNMGAARRFLRRKAFEFVFSRFDAALTLSEADRRRERELYPGRDNLFRTVPNAYVTDEMLAGPSPKPSTFPRILASGAMMPRKRLDLLLQAFALSKNVTARLTIIGDGPLRHELHRLAMSLGIAGRVELAGFTKNVVPWLRKSDLFVLSSDYEGLPAVVLEALACGVPVVSTDCFASARELLDGLDGCKIAPVGDAERLAKAIDQSINSNANPVELRRVAHEYLIDNSVSAHIMELGRIVGPDAPGSTVLEGVPDQLIAANDDGPAGARNARFLRRAALVLGLVSAGWLMRDLAGPVISSAQAATFVDDAVGAYRADLVSDAMETTPEMVRYDRAGLAKATGVHMPLLPARWRVIDIEVLPRPHSVNLEVELPDGSRLSVFGMKTRAPGAGYPIMDKRDRDNVVFWNEGDFAFALVGKMPSKTLMQSAASLDPDGPAVSA